MKTLKITLAAIFSIGLLTAVLPSNETELFIKNSNNEISKPKVHFTSNGYKKLIVTPSQG